MNHNPLQPPLFPDMDQKLIPGASALPLPAQYDRPTSVAAAVAKKSSARSDRERIFAWIESRGDRGATTDEVEVQFGLSHQSASPRIVELAGRRRGYPVRITPNGEKRPTRLGRGAEVFVVAKGQ